MRKESLFALAGILATAACGVNGAAGGGAPAADASLEPADAAPLVDGAAPSGPDGAQPGALDAGQAGPPWDAGMPAPPPFLGGNVEPGGVVFRVWAPHASAAALRGSFGSSDVAMSAIAGGVYEAHVPGAHAGDTYQFVLTTPAGTSVRTDPYCRELRASACVVVDPSAYVWKAGAFARPSRAASIVYELHVGSFAVPGGAAQGTFASTRDALAPLADLGVNVIELMPVQDFGGGSAGWGYNPQLFFAPKASYGTSDDLRSLIDVAHSLGIAVWMDTVVNHTDGWSQAPLRCFDGACPGGSAGIYFFPPGAYATTPWGPRPNYADTNVATMLFDAVDEWLFELRGDGYRWDSVSNVRALDGQGTTPGGQAFLTRANDRIHAVGGMSVAEDLKGYGAITTATSAGGFGFDAQWDGFGYTVSNVIIPADDNGRDLGSVIGALQGSSGGDPFARLLYLENHDIVGNGGARFPSRIDAASPESWTARKRSMLASVLLMTAPGVPMIFQGEDALATASFANPPGPLPPPDAAGLLVRAFYKDMIRLRRNVDGGAAGLQDVGVEILHRDDTAKVLAYRRYGVGAEDVIVVVNLKNQAYTEYDIGVADGQPWRIRLNTDAKAYGVDFAGGPTGTVTPVARSTDGRPFALPLQLGAYSALVLTR